MRLTDNNNEVKISKKAGQYVNQIYNAFLKEYKDPESAETLQHLNKLCVRLVFCYYAEDAGIFEKKQFLHYMLQFNDKQARVALENVFEILDTPLEKRPSNLAQINPKLAEFPYVNGDLFKKEPNLKIPNFTDELLLLIVNTSKNFDWSLISPTIFGAVFESTLNPATRRAGGMHYTCVENIHKVIDPLFVDELREELNGLSEEYLKAKQSHNQTVIQQKLLEYQDKLASLTFLDPACGSGNFLTEIYITLRHIENRVLQLLREHKGFVCDDCSIKVSIQQFYGIELNDFAVAVAKTAMWIAETKTFNETYDESEKKRSLLPLKPINNIVQGNALRMNWALIGNRKQGTGNSLGNREQGTGNSLGNREQEYDLGERYDSGLQRMHCLPKSHETDQEDIGFSQTASQGINEINCKNDHDNAENTRKFIKNTTNCDTIPSSLFPVPHYNYIIGNPPFVGFKYATAEQKNDLKAVFAKEIKPSLLDFVCCWFKKAAEIIQNTKTQVGFVSTNSITQGQMAGDLWNLLINKYHVIINFAHRSFVWNNETEVSARVYCVIIGFSTSKISKPKMIFDGESFDNPSIVSRINPYLMEEDNIIVTSRNKPLCNAPKMMMGNQPSDGGNLIIEDKDYKTFIKNEPNAIPYIKRYMMGEEFIKGKRRYCLWLLNTTLDELSSMPLVMERIKKVKEIRQKSPKPSTRKKASTPMLFDEIRECKDNYIAIPITSSAKRKYIPMGYLDKNIIAGNTLFMIPNATLYHFGILTSTIHMAWMRAVGARLGMGYRYSKDIVYNNFPWPTINQKLYAQIEKTAQKILKARELFPDTPLAQLYEENTMPKILREAHQENDTAVMNAYGFDLNISTESHFVKELMRRYADLVKKTEPNKS